ncbi:MAG: hypothetical protein Greene041679_457, partial [Parcubacteria group bacterium Greene0416_79]
MNEGARQKEKEKAVLLAFQNGMALIRRGLEIHGMKADGSTVLFSTSDSYERLWRDLLKELRRRVSVKHLAYMRPNVGLGV